MNIELSNAMMIQLSVDKPYSIWPRYLSRRVPIGVSNVFHEKRDVSHALFHSKTRYSNTTYSFKKYTLLIDIVIILRIRSFPLQNDIP